MFKFEISDIIEKNKPQKEIYDVVIIGGGPAGCAAAIYSRRYLLETLLISDEFGGLIADAELVDNYPGLPEVSGSELAQRFVDHAKKYNVENITGHVEKIEKKGNTFYVYYDDSFVKAKTVIICVGEKHKKLGVPGEEEFSGRGVSYCAVCDAPLYKDKIVAVIGGGNTAFVDAQLLSRYAKKVYLIHRRSWFRADPIEVERVKSNGKIELVTPYVVEKIIGENRVNKLKLKKTKEVDGRIEILEESKIVDVDGVFVDIGLIPNTEFLKSTGIELDSKGYIVVDDFMRTSIEGLFAAGDCTNKGSKFRQVVLAAAQGAIAANSAYELIRKEKKY